MPIQHMRLVFIQWTQSKGNHAHLINNALARLCIVTFAIALRAVNTHTSFICYQ